MADKMIIVGKDGVERYLITDDNIITDLRSSLCKCEPPISEEVNGEQRVCLVCGNHKPQP